jgi:hypothetical protein
VFAIKGEARAKSRFSGLSFETGKLLILLNRISVSESFDSETAQYRWEYFI